MILLYALMIVVISPFRFAYVEIIILGNLHLVILPLFCNILITIL